MKKKRPVVRARLPRVLYPVADGECVYEFEIPGYGGFPTASGLIRLRRNGDDVPEISIVNVDDDQLVVVGPLMDPNIEARKS